MHFLKNQLVSLGFSAFSTFFYLAEIKNIFLFHNLFSILVNLNKNHILMQFL